MPTSILSALFLLGCQLGKFNLLNPPSGNFTGMPFGCRLYNPLNRHFSISFLLADIVCVGQLLGAVSTKTLSVECRVPHRAENPILLIIWEENKKGSLFILLHDPDVSPDEAITSV
jgi:hypothetical protein